jgi:hypothetical protein
VLYSPETVTVISCYKLSQPQGHSAAIRIRYIEKNLCSSHNVTNQVSNAYRTMGKSIVVYIPISIFLNSRGGD